MDPSISTDSCIIQVLGTPVGESRCQVAENPTNRNYTESLKIPSLRAFQHNHRFNSALVTFSPCFIQLEISISLPKAAKIAFSITKNSNDILQSLSSEIKQVTHKFTSSLPLVRFTSSNDTKTTIGISVYEDKDVDKMANAKASFRLTQDTFGLRHFSNFNPPVQVSSSGYTLSLISQVITPETLAYQLLKRTKFRKNALEDVKTLFSVPNRLTNYFSHPGVPVAIVELLYLTIRKPSKVIDIESDILAVWALIMKQERIFKHIFDSIPDFGVQLWNLLLKDAGKHASHYETALSVIKQLSSRHGGASLLPEIIEAFGSLSSVESCSNQQKQALMASIVPLISYFDPKYVPFIVKKTKLLSFLQLVLRNMKNCNFSTELSDHLFSLMRYLGKANVDLFNEYQLWQPIQELSKDTQNSSRQLLAYKLLEQFGIAEDNSLVSLLDSFQQTTDMRVKVKGLQLIEASIRSSPPSSSLSGIIAKEMSRLLTEPLFLVVETAQKILEMLDISFDDFIASGLFNAYASMFESICKPISEPEPSANAHKETTTLSPPFPPIAPVSESKKYGDHLSLLDTETKSKLSWFLRLFHKLILLHAKPTSCSFSYKSDNAHLPRHEKVNHAMNLSLPEVLQRHFIDIDLYHRLSGPLKRGWDQLDIKQHISFWMRILKTTPELYKSHFSSISQFLKDMYLCLSINRSPDHRSGERAVQEDILLAYLMIKCDLLKEDVKDKHNRISTLVASYPPQFFNACFRKSGANWIQKMGPDYALAYPEGMRTEIWNSFSIELRSFFVYSLSYEGENKELLSQISDSMLSQMVWNMQTPLEVFDLVLHLSARIFDSFHLRDPVKLCNILLSYSHRVWRVENVLTMASRVELDTFARWCFFALRLQLDPDQTGNLIFKGPPLQEPQFKDLTKTVAEVSQHLSTSLISFAREFPRGSNDTYLKHWYEDMDVVKNSLMNNSVFSPEFTAVVLSFTGELLSKSEADFVGLPHLEAVWNEYNDPSIALLLLSDQLNNLINFKKSVPVPLIEQVVTSIQMQWPKLSDVYATRTNISLRVGFAFQLSLLLEYLLNYDDHNGIVPCCGFSTKNERSISWGGYSGCTIPTTALGNRRKRSWSFNPRLNTDEPKLNPNGAYVIGKSIAIRHLVILHVDITTEPELPKMDWSLRMSLVGRLLNVLTSCIDALSFDEIPPDALPAGSGLNSRVPPAEAPGPKICAETYVYMIMWMAEVVSTVAAYPCPSINKPAMRWVLDSYYHRLRIPYQCELDHLLFDQLHKANDMGKGLILEIWGSSQSCLPESLHIWLFLHNNDPEMVGKIFDAIRRLIDSRDFSSEIHPKNLDYFANLMLKKYLEHLSMLLADPVGFERTYIMQPSKNGGKGESSTTALSALASTATHDAEQYVAWEDIDELNWSKKGQNGGSEQISPTDSPALLSMNSSFFYYENNGWKDPRPMILGQDQFKDQFEQPSSFAADGPQKDDLILKRQQQYISVYSKAIGAIFRFLSTVSTAFKLNHPKFVLEQPFITDPTEWDSITFKPLNSTSLIATEPIGKSKSFPQAVSLDYTVYILSCWLNYSRMESYVHNTTGMTLSKPSTREKEIDRSLIPSLVGLAWNILGRCSQIESLPLSIRAHAGLVLEALLVHEQETGDSRLRPSHSQWKSCVLPAMSTFLAYLPTDTDSPIKKVALTEIQISTATQSSHPDQFQELSSKKARSKNHGSSGETKSRERRKVHSLESYSSHLLDGVGNEIEKLIWRIANTYADIAPPFSKKDEIVKKCELLVESAEASHISTSQTKPETDSLKIEEEELLPSVGSVSPKSSANEDGPLSSGAPSTSISANVPPPPPIEGLKKLTNQPRKEDSPKPSNPSSTAPMKPKMLLVAKFHTAHPLVNEWVKAVIKLRRKLSLFLNLAKLNPRLLSEKYLYRIESCETWSVVDPTLDSAPENLCGVFLGSTQTTKHQLHSRLSILAKHVPQDELVLLEGSLLQKLATIVTLIRALPRHSWRSSAENYENELVGVIHSIVAMAVATPQEALKFVTSPFWRQHSIDRALANNSYIPTVLMTRIGSLVARSGALHLESLKLYREQLETQLSFLLTEQFITSPTIPLALGKDALAYQLLTSESYTHPDGGLNEDQFWKQLPCDILWGLIADAHGTGLRDLVYHGCPNKWMPAKLFVISSILANSPRIPLLDRIVKDPSTMSADDPLLHSSDRTSSEPSSPSHPHPLLHQIGDVPAVYSTQWKIGEMKKPVNGYGNQWFSSLTSDYVFIRSANCHNLLIDIMAFLEYTQLNKKNDYFNNHTRKFVEDSLADVGLEPHIVLPLAKTHRKAPFTHANEDIFKTNGLLINLGGMTKDVTTFRAIPHSRMVNVWSEQWSTRAGNNHWLDFLVTDMSVGAQMRIGVATKDAIEKINKNPFLYVGDVEGSFSISTYEAGVFYSGHYLPSIDLKGLPKSISMATSLKLSYDPSNCVIHFTALTESSNSKKQNSDELVSSISISPTSIYSDELFVMMSFASSCTFTVYKR